jgi:hypothetical protein
LLFEADFWLFCFFPFPQTIASLLVLIALHNPLVLKSVRFSRSHFMLLRSSSRPDEQRRWSLERLVLHRDRYMLLQGPNAVPEVRMKPVWCLTYAHTKQPYFIEEVMEVGSKAIGQGVSIEIRRSTYEFLFGLVFASANLCINVHRLLLIEWLPLLNSFPLCNPNVG